MNVLVYQNIVDAYLNTKQIICKSLVSFFFHFILKNGQKRMFNIYLKMLIFNILYRIIHMLFMCNFLLYILHMLLYTIYTYSKKHLLAKYMRLRYIFKLK